MTVKFILFTAHSNQVQHVFKTLIINVQKIDYLLWWPHTDYKCKELVVNDKDIKTTIYMNVKVLVRRHKIIETFWWKSSAKVQRKKSLAMNFCHNKLEQTFCQESLTKTCCFSYVHVLRRIAQWDIPHETFLASFDHPLKYF